MLTSYLEELVGFFWKRERERGRELKNLYVLSRWGKGAELNVSGVNFSRLEKWKEAQKQRNDPHSLHDNTVGKQTNKQQQNYIFFTIQVQ